MTSFTKKSQCLLEITGEENSVLRIAADRIHQYFPGIVDVVHHIAGKEERSNYDLSIILGRYEDCAEIAALWENDKPNDGDAFIVQTVAKKPLTLAAIGIGDRGTMYAAYHVAELLEREANLDNEETRREPIIKKRCAWTDMRTHGWMWRRALQPSVFTRTLAELPRYGINSVKLPFPISQDLVEGYSGMPFIETENGVIPLEPEYSEWKHCLKEVQEYGFESKLWVCPVTPPEFSHKEICDYYGGKIQLDGYEAAVEKTFRKHLQDIVTFFPEITCFEFLNTEVVSYAGVQLFIAPCCEDTCSRVLSVYLRILQEVCDKEGKQPSAAMHCFGVSNRTIQAMREVHYQYPRVILLEDDYWNNPLWITGNVLEYLPEPMRQEIHEKVDLGFISLVDGEFFGGGTLPTAIPRPIVTTIKEAVRRQSHEHMMRVNLHSETPGGGAFWDINEIIVIAGAACSWSPEPDIDMVWSNWITRRFGADACSQLLPMLKKCDALITKGFTLEGLDLLNQSQINAKNWLGTSAKNYNRFELFQKPGIFLLDKTEADEVLSNEITLLQMKSKSVALADALKDKNEALRIIEEGLETIASLQPLLEEADYAYLYDMYYNAQCMVQAIILLCKAAYATQIMLDNYDDIVHPKEQFDTALSELAAYADEIEQIPTKPSLINERWPVSLQETLREVVSGYRKMVEKETRRA